jgi:hypothetical protein
MIPFRHLSRSVHLSSRRIACRKLSDSITYSGGHASQGQGGFYGSGGSRAKNNPLPAHHPEALARVADIKVELFLFILVSFIHVNNQGVDVNHGYY